MTSDHTSPATGEPTDPDVDLADARQRREMRRSHYGVLAMIALGGALGALTRYEAGLIWPTAAGAFPWTTLLVNAAGCLGIGCFLVAITEIWSAHPMLRPFFGTGVLGGFTTFSTFCVDIERLVNGGQATIALAYLAVTVLTALAAVTAGAWTTRRVLRNWSTS
jgi:fluoride exporter